MPTYKIQHVNGKFSHVDGKREALAQARAEAGAPAGTREEDLRSHWGVSLLRLSPTAAKLLG